MTKQVNIPANRVGFQPTWHFGSLEAGGWRLEALPVVDFEHICLANSRCLFAFSISIFIFILV